MTSGSSAPVGARFIVRVNKYAVFAAAHVGTIGKKVQVGMRSECESITWPSDRAANVRILKVLWGQFCVRGALEGGGGGDIILLGRSCAQLDFQSVEAVIIMMGDEKSEWPGFAHGNSVPISCSAMYCAILIQRRPRGSYPVLDTPLLRATNVRQGPPSLDVDHDTEELPSVGYLFLLYTYILLPVQRSRRSSLLAVVPNIDIPTANTLSSRPRCVPVGPVFPRTAPSADACPGGGVLGASLCGDHYESQAVHFRDELFGTTTQVPFPKDRTTHRVIATPAATAVYELFSRGSLCAPAAGRALDASVARVQHWLSDNGHLAGQTLRLIGRGLTACPTGDETMMVAYGTPDCPGIISGASDVCTANGSLAELRCV
ncbi:hypothetical protein EVG20_g2141 [Dentipellis fragilis]|uniref:Uncharacterized protein n=1 Tax=Dentipellis fragilis TaxID=205917 RepID=A0A4Y9ZAK1_9AGAM|nr:hypothetical protein EVG20_g2141 [Dentipellis fragilis]